MRVSPACSAWSSLTIRRRLPPRAGPPAGAQPHLPAAGEPYDLSDTAACRSSAPVTAVTAAVDLSAPIAASDCGGLRRELLRSESALNCAAHDATSELGNYDALLAVATTGREYAFLVPSAMPGVSEAGRPTRRYWTNLALHFDGDYSGAAVAEANRPSPVTQFVEPSCHGRHHRHRRRAGGDAIGNRRLTSWPRTPRRSHEA